MSTVATGTSSPGLGERLARRDRPLLLFSVTPPREATPPEERQRIAAVTLERVRPLPVDALLLYDIDDESDRNPQQRPFPFLPTLDPARFHAGHLARAGWDRPVVVYRCAGKYHPDALARWLADQDPQRVGTVLVGASSSSKRVRTTLVRAQELARAAAPALPTGGVAIPERHSRRGDEHRRMLAKQAAGCRFFVSQIVYDADAAKAMVADYRYACADAGTDPVPVVFTLSVCGSLRTLEFLRWLGVQLPRWMRHELERAEDPLAVSAAQCLATAQELAVLCERLGQPFGVNVESVSNRRAEIEASVRLARELGERIVSPAGEPATTAGSVPR